MKIFKTADNDRKHGKTLKELGRTEPYAYIYRAVGADVSTINNMDYVTLSRKWAKGHAEHMAATEETTQVVLMAFVPSEKVAEAYNPDEYFYIGQNSVKGTVVDRVYFEV